MRPRKDFQSNAQYKRYTIAIDYAKRMKDFMEKGYLVFDPDDGSIVKGKIDIPEDDEWAAVNLHVNDHVTLTLIEFSYGDDSEKPWMEQTLKDITNTFKSYKIINPKHIQQFC